jgi:nucleoside-diphosphate-sugar epimerase
MAYMPDAISGMVNLMAADAARLRYRNAYNITAMSVTPDDIAAAIRKHVSGFEIDYDIDPVRQAIADSWPRSLDDSAARADWDWKPRFDLEAMTRDMLARLKEKLKVVRRRER